MITAAIARAALLREFALSARHADFGVRRGGPDRGVRDTRNAWNPGMSSREVFAIAEIVTVRGVLAPLDPTDLCGDGSPTPPHFESACCGFLFSSPSDMSLNKKTIHEEPGGVIVYHSGLLEHHGLCENL